MQKREKNINNYYKLTTSSYKAEEEEMEEYKMKPSELIEIEFQRLLRENPRRKERIQEGEELVAIKLELVAIKNYLDSVTNS